MALSRVETGIWGFLKTSEKPSSRVLPEQRGDILAELRTAEPATGAASHRLLLWSSGHVALLGSALGRQQPLCEVVVLASASLEQGLGKQMTSG